MWRWAQIGHTATKKPPRRAADPERCWLAASVRFELGKYVVLKKRTDGTHRVLFQVPAHLRPTGWKPAITLPLDGDWPGTLKTPEIAAIQRALEAGVPASDILIDPGIGFGKTADHNVALLRDLEALRLLGHPILLGTSRKSTLGRILDLPVEERLEATLATTALGIAAGVDLVRVHDVQANVRAARVSDAIVRGTWRADQPQADQPQGGPR